MCISIPVDVSDHSYPVLSLIPGFMVPHHYHFIPERSIHIRSIPMCIAIPAEVIEIKEGNIGVVDYGDLKQEVRLDLVDVSVGEFVLVHVGFAIQKLSREEGLETRELFREVYSAMEQKPPVSL
jgi:hydrogenase expression/formation protein HypC